MNNPFQRWLSRMGDPADRSSQSLTDPMHELDLDEIDEILCAGVGLAQDTWGAAQVSRDASHPAWSLSQPVPATMVL